MASREHWRKNVIRFEEVTKKYGSIDALSGVSFAVGPGEVFGYVGPNGAGKTTSIRILTGLIRDFGGRVFVDGHEVREGWDRVHRLIGYLPQEAGFQEWRTVAHALWTFGRLSGITSGTLRRRIDEVLATVGLEDAGGRKIVHLSGGQVQRLRLAQALLHDPPILILDEPLSGLDPEGRRRLKDIITGLAGQDRLVFFSSHILQDVEDVATTVGILSRGRMMKIGSPGSLREEFRIGNVVALEGVELSGVPWESVQEIEGTETTPDGAIRVRLSAAIDLDAGVRAVLGAILSSGARVRSVRVVEPSLEEVYMHYAGGDR